MLNSRSYPLYHIVDHFPYSEGCKVGPQFNGSAANKFETEVKLMDADALTVLITKYFPHELLRGSDAISRGSSECRMN